MRDKGARAGRRRSTIGVAAGALLLGAWWVFRVTPGAPTPPAGAASSTSGASAPAVGGGPQAAIASSKPAPSTSPAAAAAADQARAALAQYLVFSELPPWSRAADDSQKHLWDWNATTPQGQAFTRDAKGRAVSASLALDRMFAAPGEAITATVSVWYGDYDTGSPQPADAKVVGWIEAWRAGGDAGTPGGFAPVEKVTFTSRAGGPGHRYTATFTPSALAALRAQLETRFVARVDPGDHEFPFAQPFRYAATDALVILERHADQKVAGSLEVTLAADVKRLGPVMVQATLFDAAGTQPIAVYDDYYRPAQLGPQEITITFFGKAIHDRGVDGPYRVRALHGYVRVADAEPPELFWKSEATITTQPYTAGEFSGAEWDSPEKQAKINQYKRMIESFERSAL